MPGSVCWCASFRRRRDERATGSCTRPRIFLAPHGHRLPQDRRASLLFEHLPRDAKLHLAGADDVDAALAAEILLAADRNLEPYQRTAIARFAATERERVSAQIKRLYSDRDPAYERFRRQVTKGEA